VAVDSFLPAAKDAAMTRRTLLPWICFVFSVLACLPSAHAGLLNITFQGAVTSSVDDYGNLFDAGVGSNTIVGDAVTGSILIDLDLAARRSTDYEVGGDAYYSANQYIGPERYITSQINIGGRNFVLGPSVTYPSDEESVWMFRAEVPDFEGPRDFMAIQDEYYYENDNGVSSFNLDVSIIDVLDTFLSTLDLDQEFSWFDNSDLPGSGAGGRLWAETDEGIGIASFELNSVQAALVPAEVPEPVSLGFLLLALLVGMGLRRRHS